MPTSRREKQRVVERIAETQDGHQCLRTETGRVYEGWIIEVTETALVFMHAPSPFHAQATGGRELAPPNEEIALDQIAAWMDETGRWVEF